MNNTVTDEELDKELEDYENKNVNLKLLAKRKVVSEQITVTWNKGLKTNNDLMKEEIKEILVFLLDYRK